METPWKMKITNRTTVWPSNEVSMSKRAVVLPSLRHYFHWPRQGNTCLSLGEWLNKMWCIFHMQGNTIQPLKRKSCHLEQDGWPGYMDKWMKPGTRINTARFHLYVETENQKQRHTEQACHSQQLEGGRGAWTLARKNNFQISTAHYHDCG